MRNLTIWNFINKYHLIILIIWILFYAWFKNNKRILWESLNCKRLLNDAETLWKYFLMFSFAIYACILVYLTLVGRTRMEKMQYELSFLWEYRLALAGNVEWMKQILNNIMLFVPFGIFYREQWLWKKQWKWALFAGCLYSCTSEFLQLILRLGLFEFDDIFNNSIGMMLGYGVAVLIEKYEQDKLFK